MSDEHSGGRPDMMRDALSFGKSSLYNQNRGKPHASSSASSNTQPGGFRGNSFDSTDDDADALHYGSASSSNAVTPGGGSEDDGLFGWQGGRRSSIPRKPMVKCCTWLDMAVMTAAMRTIRLAHLCGLCVRLPLERRILNCTNERPTFEEDNIMWH